MEMRTTRNDHPLRPQQHWWREQPEELTTLSEHIVDKLVDAGLTTVAEVRAAGPARIKSIDGIGKVAFEEIKQWLRSLDDEASH